MPAPSSRRRRISRRSTLGDAVRLFALPLPAHVPRPHRADAAQLCRGRAGQAAARGAGGGARVADAVADAGYGSESRVYEKTGELLGMTPGALRRGGKGEVIRTAFADCPFGRLLVGATDRGVCFIGFAEPDEALLGDLRQRFPRAQLVADDAALAEWCGLCWTSWRSRSRRWTCRSICAARRSSSVSGARCAASRRRDAQLWRIGAHDGRSASRCGRGPLAARAIRYRLAVPCHRVVGSDGSLTGLSLGSATQARAAGKERAACLSRRSAADDDGAGSRWAFVLGAACMPSRGVPRAARVTRQHRCVLIWRKRLRSGIGMISADPCAGPAAKMVRKRHTCSRLEPTQSPASIDTESKWAVLAGNSSPRT